MVSMVWTLGPLRRLWAHVTSRYQHLSMSLSKGTVIIKFMAMCN